MTKCNALTIIVKGRSQSKMHGGYTHLTKEERDMIAVLRAEGATLSDIALRIGKHRRRPRSNG